MAVGAQVKSVILSTEKTKKITGAMHLMAASKLQKTQQKMSASRPYADKMLQVIGHVAACHSELKHPYMQAREETHHLYLVVTTDRGLCGGLNSNLLKAVLASMQAKKEQGIETSLCLIGNKGVQFFRRLEANILAETTHLGDRPTANDLVGVVKVALNAYLAEEVSHITLAYNQFTNTMVQTPHLLDLLPLVSLEEQRSGVWDYLYEPDAAAVLQVLLDRYIESEVYQGVVENIACEQAARMVAMQSATDNAQTVIDELKLLYNKARQAAITQELAEIVAGSQAV